MYRNFATCWNAPRFYIWAPDYSYTHSGRRCLFLLCHHLNRLGYEAYITGKDAPAGLLVPYADIELIAGSRDLGIEDIVVYPEVVKGNPLGGRNIVRYLLNVPGALNDVSPGDYGADDFIVHFAGEYRHLKLPSRGLRIPLIDPTVFNRRPVRRRKGYLLYSGRHTPDLSTIPDWVSPYVLISRANPRDPPALAELYRESLGLVVWENTAAIGEAMHCGCPVICIPTPGVRFWRLAIRCLGCGLTHGWNRRGAARALATVPVATFLYRLRGIGLDWRIHRFVRRAIRHFERPKRRTEGDHRPVDTTSVASGTSGIVP